MTAPRRRAPRKAAAPQQSQRDRLLRRPRPTVTYRLLVDPDGLPAAEAELAEARKADRQTRMRGTAAEKRAAATRLAGAEATVDGCYETLTFRALPTAGEVTFEKLAAAHPATREQLEQARAERQQAQQRGEDVPPYPSWAPTFWPVLLAACCENGMSADDWAEFLGGNVSDGELAGIRRTLLSLNEMERAADPALPFDWTRMLNSTSKSR